MKSMESDDEVKENHPKPSDDSVSLQQEESLLMPPPMSSHCSKSFALPTEDSMDSPAVKTQEVGHISNEGDSNKLEQNELSGIAETTEKLSTDGDEMHLEKDVRTEQEPAPAYVVASSSSSSSSTLDTPVLVEVESIATESRERPCNVNPISETDNALRKENEELEIITEMDVGPNLSDVTGVETVTADEGKSSKRSDPTATSEEAGDVQLVTSSVASSTFIDSVRDTEVTNTENGPEMGKSLSDSCGLGMDSQDATVSEIQENVGCLGKDTDVPEDNPRLSSCSDSISSVANEKVQERLENDASIKPLDEEGGNETQVPGEVNDMNSPLKLNGDNRPPSPHKSSVLKMEDGESSADCKSGHTDVEPQSKMDVDTERLNSEILADHGPSSSDLQETKTIDNESLKENTHSLCRRLSQDLETHPEKSNVGVNIELISTNKKSPQPLPNLEKEGVIEKAAVKDLPQDSMDASNQKVNSVSPTTSLEQSVTATDGQKECLETCTNVTEKQSPDIIGEKKHSPVANSTTTQLSKCISKVRSEMGPPLPRLLTPVSTPPKVGKYINPRQAIGKLSFPSPMDGLVSPTTPNQFHLTPNSQQQSSSALNSPVPPNGVPSSPLQFGSATPKHAVPVPGRLPHTATLSSSGPSQENSMRILDTMYPELSAHGRTLSILRGNVSLGVCSSESTTSSTAGSQMSGFKTINSTSTAFTKTEMRGRKRQSVGSPQPKSSKCLRLDNCSPTASHKQVPSSSSNSGEESTSPQDLKLKESTNEATSPMEIAQPSGQNLIANALKKIENQCFDLLPVIQSHLYVGNLPKKPVLRSEEKEVIADICQNSLVSVPFYWACNL